MTAPTHSFGHLLLRAARPGRRRMVGALLTAGMVLLLCQVLPARAQTGAAALTPEERAWVAAHPVVRVASSRSYGPFTFVDENGRVRGLSVDYLARLEALSGLHLQLMPPMPFAESMQALKEGRLDMIMSLRETEERKAFLSFTRPYISVPAVLLRRRDDRAGAGQPAGDLAPGESVALSRGYAVGAFLSERFPGNPQTVEADDRSLLRRLAGGEIEAGVMDLAGATYLMRTEGIGNVRVAGDVGFSYDLAIAYRKDWPLLGRVLQKALDRIDAGERQAIADQWIPLNGERSGFRREVVIGASVVLALGLLSVALLVLWNRSLRRQVALRSTQLQAELAERERLQAVDRARELAELASKAKTEFMSQASHELRTPLNAVLGFAQLLENDRARPLDATQRQRVEHIGGAARHLLVLIEDMMSFSRLESGSLVVEPRALDVDPLLQRCVALAMPAAAEAGIALQYERGGVLPEAMADPVRLEQVMHNLLSNAIKYNRAGGWVRVRASSPGPALLRVDVSDGGLGLSPEQQSQLFQPFNRLGRSEQEGTGIGLVICKQLMERMGGRILVQSAAGQGSRFSIELGAVPP